MPRINELQLPGFIKDAEKHRRVTPDLRVVAQKPVHVVECPRRIRPQRHAGECPLQHGRQQRCSQPFSAHVRQKKSCPLFIQGKHVEVISPDRQAGKIHAKDGQVRIILEIFRQQGLLNVSRDANLLLQPLPFSFAFHQPRIVQNAGRVGRQRVQDLPVQLGECRRAF